ncbi:MAG: YhbY family RNA-binding protein [Gammaproteobacteria bacterium]|jgi:RNA-binding protein|nr:YhbY family RNA-binding protein [Gammaproteobacteria bacterium]
MNDSTPTPGPVLTERQRKHLRGLGHALKPVSRLGNAGVTAAFLAELEGALAHHELVKLKVSAASRADRNAAIEAAALRTGAAVITRVGNMALLYRPRPDGTRLELPPA